MKTATARRSGPWMRAGSYPALCVITSDAYRE